MIRLEKHDNILALKFSGLSSEDFGDALARARLIAGKRWNPETKAHEWPADYATAQKIIYTLEPELDTEASRWYREARQEAQKAILTEIPDDAELPEPWHSKLRPYQRAGVEFLLQHPKTIVADEMGLGKTIEAIAAISLYSSTGEPKLVVAPNSVTQKWKREIQKWTGEEAVIISGNAAKRKQQLERAVKQGKWVIVNWEKLRIMPELQKVKWQAVVADEAHRAKNRKAQQTKALWKIHAPMQLALTGTPIQNSPDEIWSLLKWLDPKTYTSYWRFFNDYVDYYDTHWKKEIIGVKNPDGLRFELATQMIRREAEDVLDLPPLSRIEIPIELGSKQRKIYDDFVDQMWVEIERAAAEGDGGAKKALENPQYLVENGAARTTRLRQAASTPALLGGDDDSAKLDAAVEIIKDAPRDKKFVVFSEFKGTTEILFQRLQAKGIKTDYIHGDVNKTLREEIIQDMQEGDLQVLVMTRDTGGEGIDLFAADTAIFIERHWTPARNEQAEARIHRMGQDKPVTIYTLTACDTIDDGKVKPANTRKSRIVADVLGKGN